MPKHKKGSIPNRYSLIQSIVSSSSGSDSSVATRNILNGVLNCAWNKTSAAPAALADYVMKSLAWDNGMLTGVTSAGATGPAVYAPRSITSDGTNAMVTGFYVGNIQEWPLANWTLFGDQVFGKQTISQHERILMMAPQAVLHQSAADIALEGNPSAVVNEDGTPNTTGFFVITPGD